LDATLRNAWYFSFNRCYLVMKEIGNEDVNNEDLDNKADVSQVGSQIK
jgi:hypothetical protein